MFSLSSIQITFMQKKLFIPFLALSLATSFIIMNSCKKDVAPAEKAKDYSFYQGFDSTEAIQQQGWTAKNNSRPFGTTTWGTGEYHWLNDPKKGISAVGTYPGNSTTHSGEDYIICTFNSTGAVTAPAPAKATSSDWLISPAVPMKNGDIITFYTRTKDNPTTAPDRLELRINQVNSGVEVGNDSSSVGDFTKLALSVNPNLTSSGYPGDWTAFSYTISGSPVPKLGRFAFRYYVSKGGPTGPNGTGVGIDDVNFTSKIFP